jgi:hypothetical protein
VRGVRGCGQSDGFETRGWLASMREKKALSSGNSFQDIFCISSELEHTNGLHTSGVKLNLNLTLKAENHRSQTLNGRCAA